MKAMPIIWEKPHISNKHVVLKGSFHNHALMMVGHKMAGSSYASILVEVNQVTSGCMQCVLSGYNYAKSLWCLKAVSGGLERLLFTVFIDGLAQDSPHHTSNIAALSSLCIVSPYTRRWQELNLTKPHYHALHRIMWNKMVAVLEVKAAPHHIECHKYSSFTNKTPEIWIPYIWCCHLENRNRNMFLITCKINWCRIYASWKTALISLVTHVCVKCVKSFYLSYRPRGKPTKQCQANVS